MNEITKVPGVRVLQRLMVAIALACGPGAHADLERAKPGDAGMTQAGLDALNSAMHKLVDDKQLSGVITAVARHGKLVNFDVYGQRSVEEKLPMTPDTIFRIYSMTKPIVGVGLMALHEEGKFRLEDPVEKYLPQFRGLKVAAGDGEDGMPILEPARHPMTIRELVSHTGGLTYGFFSRSQVDTLYQRANVLDRDSTLAEMVDKLGKIPLRQQPGSAWHYSVSVDVQGRLIEVLAGEPLDTFLQKRIFTPLGMKDTAFWVPADKADRFARIYNRNLQSTPNGDDYLTRPAFLSGGGGLVATTTDYLRFAQMVLNEGALEGVRVLKPATVRLMRTNQLPDSIAQINPRIGNPGNTFGIDFAIVEKPDGKISHKRARSEIWWYGVGGTWMGINPEQGTVIVGMIQSRGGASREARLTSKRLMYEAIVEK